MITNVLNVPMALVIVIDEDRLNFKSAVGLPEPWVSGREIGLSTSFYRHMIEGTELLIENVGDDAKSRDFLSIPGLSECAFAGIPLLTADGLVLGSVCAIADTSRRWEEADRTTLRDLAVMVTTEIELRASALVAERQARRVLGLQHVTESLSAVSTPAEAARVVLERGAIVLGAEAGLVGLLTENGHGLRVIAAIGHQIDTVNGIVTLDAPLPTAEAVRTQESVYFDSRSAVLDHYAGADLTPYSAFYDQYEAVAAVPLIVHGRVIGGLSLRFRNIVDFAEDGTDFFETLARQCAQAVDRTQLLEAERHARDQVERLARAKEEFLSDVAHDLQNPLASIKGFAQILLRYVKRGTLNEERVLRSATQIEATALRMGDLIQELLDVATIERGNPVILRKAPVDLLALVQRTIDSQEVRAADHDIEVHTERDSIVGEWDERRLERVLANLLSNAIKYSASDGRIEVSIGDEGSDTAVLAVRDRGIGIPDTDLPYVFDRFRRGSNVEATTSGTGLGLAGVKQLVEQHGGTIDIESTVGEGTMVTLRLPIAGSYA